MATELQLPKTMRILVVLVAVLSACSASTSGGGGPGSGSGGKGDGSGSGNGSGGLTPADFLTKLGMVDCDQAFTCKSTFPTNMGVTFEQAWGASQSACYADESPADYLAKVGSEIAAGKIHYDAGAAAACLAGITAPNCATLWTNGPSYPSTCGTALAGTVADGGACVVDYDCSNLMSICIDTTMKCGPDPQGARVQAEPARLKELLESL